jgi:hypothetical protein
MCVCVCVCVYVCVCMCLCVCVLCTPLLSTLRAGFVDVRDIRSDEGVMRLRECADCSKSFLTLIVFFTLNFNPRQTAYT